MHILTCLQPHTQVCVSVCVGVCVIAWVLVWALMCICEFVPGAPFGLIELDRLLIGA